MLTYLILTTRALIFCAAAIGAVTGYACRTESKKEYTAVKWIALGSIAGSFIIAYLENRTNIVDTAILNGVLYSVSIISFLLFLILSLPKIRKSMGMVRAILIGLTFASVFMYATPVVWGYPYQVYLSERTVISTEFLVDMIGLIFGLILSFLIYLAARKCVLALKDKEAGILTALLMLLNAGIRLAGLFAVLLQKRVVVSNHLMFSYSVMIKNNTDKLTFAALAVLAIAYIVLIIRGITQNEPYDNPAEARKIIAKWRKVRRWGITAIIASMLGVLTLTYFEVLNTPDTSLSPIEEVSSEDDDNMYVNYDLLQDGHIHRFAYTTDKGTAIRFIIIKKPNANAYGIGLDACDICGETGYYERDGQVVCNLCDQVININSIGFKGGCNPIVIPYELSEGKVVIPKEGLLEYEQKFK